MAKKISASVGKGGKNKPADTQAVQELLNAFAKKCGFKQLDVDGKVGPKTNAAISSFQKKVVGMSKADGRVDAKGRSMSALAMGPKKAEAEAKKAEKQGEKGKANRATGSKGSPGKGSSAETKKKKKGAGNGKPQVKGDTRGVDKRLLAVLEAVSAHYGKPIVVETGKQASQATTDGEQLWQRWRDDLDSGKRDPILRRNEKLRKQLDALYSHKEFDKFMRLVKKNSKKSAEGASDAHASGRAVDIKRSTDAKVVAAIATILRREDEGNVIHFDDNGKSLPKTITEAMKKKWK